MILIFLMFIAFSFFYNISNHIFFNGIILYVNKTALYTAIENENVDIAKLLLCNDKIDINLYNILIFFFYKIKYLQFNDILYLLIF